MAVFKFIKYAFLIAVASNIAVALDPYGDLAGIIYWMGLGISLILLLRHRSPDTPADRQTATNHPQRHETRRHQARRRENMRRRQSDSVRPIQVEYDPDALDLDTAGLFDHDNHRNNRR